MEFDKFEHTRKLIQEIRDVLPDFARMCSDLESDFVVIHQDGFAPGLGANEMFLLGKAIKYAGLMRKEVRIIPSPSSPS